PNSIWPTNFSSGRLSPSHSSVENFVSCAFSRERSLLSCTWGRLRDRLDFSQKHFSHGFRPWPLHKPSKPQKLLALLQSASKSEETPVKPAIDFPKSLEYNRSTVGLRKFCVRQEAFCACRHRWNCRSSELGSHVHTTAGRTC